MIEMSFYRCDQCRRVGEGRTLVADGKCKCGSRRFRPTKLSSLEITFYLMRQPRAVIRAIRGK